MKITTTGDDLKRVVSLLKSIIPRGEDLWSDKILLITGITSLTVQATNGQSFVSMIIPCDVHVDGSEVIALKRLENLATLVSDSATIEKKGTILEVKYKKSRITIPTMLKDAFPGPPVDVEGDESVSLRVNTDSFLKMVQIATVAAGRSDINRWTFSGIQTIVTNQQISLTGCDGSQISRAIGMLMSGTGTEEKMEFLLPSSLIGGVISLCKNTEENEIEIEVFDNVVGFYTSKERVYIRKLSGNYPDIDKVLGIDHLYSMKIEKDQFLSTLKNALMFSQGFGYVDLDVQKTEVKVYCASTEGEFEDTFNVECAGLEILLHIGASGPHLMECIKNSGKDVIMRFSDNDRTPLYFESMFGEISSEFLAARMSKR